MESSSPNQANGQVDLSALVSSASPAATPATPTPAPAPTLVTPEVLASELSEVVKPSEPPRPRRRWLRLVLWAGLAVVLTGAGMIAAAELGVLNSGIDRLYARTKLPFLWGSLPADFTTAITAALERPGAMAMTTEDGENRLRLQFEVKPADNLSLPQIGWLKKVYASESRLASETTPNPATVPADNQTSTPLGDISGDLQLTTTVLADLSKLQLDLTLNSQSNGQTFALTSSAIIVDNEVYVLIPSTPALAEATGLPQNLLGKYVHSSLPASFRDELRKVIADSQSKTGYEILAENYDAERVEIDRIIQTVGQRIKRVGIERRDGRLASHWRLELDKPGLQQLLQEMTQSDVNSDEFAQQISTTDLTWDIWVGHRRYELIGSHLSLTTSTTFGQGQLQAQSDTTNKPTLTTITAPAANRLIEWADFQKQVPLFGATAISTPEEVPNLSNASAQERDDARRERIDNLAGLVETAQTLNETLPDSTITIRLNDNGHPVVQQLRTLAEKYGASKELVDSYLQDPLPNQYYFGYRKEGGVVTLTAVLEDKTATDCRRQSTAAGELCILEKQVSL